MNDFVTQHGITATSEWVSKNPNMADSADMDHWRVRLQRDCKSFAVIYSKGSGHNGAKPTASEVLESLASETAGLDESFKDWAANYGFDASSQQTKRIHRACVRHTERLRRFLGDDLFETLLEVEAR